MANENQQSTLNGTQGNGEGGFLAKIKGLFQKSQNGKGNQQKNQRSTKAFHLTRRDGIISLFAALAVIGGAVYYLQIVYNEYNNLNNRSLELKNFVSYGISPNEDKLSSYAGGNDIGSINGLIEANSKIKQRINDDTLLLKQQKNYYDIILKYIYFPSINIWKDPYTKNFDMSIVGEKFLEKNPYEELYLVESWSNFIEFVGDDADYNSAENTEIGEGVVDDSNPDFFYLPITIRFKSPNKRAFLLLVNKLSMTSNQSNIALLDEFFSYLLNAINDGKSEEINQLMEDYREDFSSSSSWEGPSDLADLTGEDLIDYRNQVIGYNLYHWIKGNLGEDTELIDDDIIIRAIRNTASCDELADDDSKEVENKMCFYNFREKYRDLPYLAYKIGLEKQANRKKGLLEFLQNLPPIIAITDFSFDRHSSSSFLNDEEGEYEGNVTFRVYGKNISPSELDEASLMLGKLCFGNDSDIHISPSLALDRVKSTIAAYGEDREYRNAFLLLELQDLFTDIQETYDGLTDYKKMIKLFEIWRMMNEGNLCEK